MYVSSYARHLLKTSANSKLYVTASIAAMLMRSNDRSNSKPHADVVFG